jgi:2,4-dienoyl-CoA reductase-like NADH-dependent reductase (Old Yellow Enzyme family)
MNMALDRGFELLAMARPLIMEPDLIARMEKGETVESMCEPCNRCIGAMDRGPATCKLLEEREGR